LVADLYATPDHSSSSDDPIDPLPGWFHDFLDAPAATYQTLRDVFIEEPKHVR
jgi:hypothetical protein